MEREPKGLEIGTTALDVLRKGKFTDDPFMGDLALVGPDNRVIDSGILFELPPYDQLINGFPGGIGNTVIAIDKVSKATQLEEPVQINWAIMALLGPDEVGTIWSEKIPQSIHKILLINNKIPFSGVSDVRIQSNEYATDTVPAGERAIYFRAGASGATEFSLRYLWAIIRYKPFNVNISYPGLFPDGADRSNGKNLAAFTRIARKICPCLSMDVHGFTKLTHIEPALPYADMFNANLSEAACLFLNRSVSEHISEAEKQKLYRKIAEVISGKYLRLKTTYKDGRCRLFTITDKCGTFIIFQNANKIVEWDYVPSPCAAIPAIDKTGAGDVRFGIQRLFTATRQNELWSQGRYTLENAKLAVNVGQIATTFHIQGKEADALNDISLSALEKTVKSGLKFHTFAKLQQTVKHTQCDI